MADRRPQISQNVIFGGPTDDEMLPAIVAKVLKVENPIDDRGECQLFVLDPKHGISTLHAYYSAEPQAGHWSFPKFLN